MKWVKGAGGVAQVVGPCGARGEGERARGDRSTGVVAVTTDQVDDRPPGLDCRTEGPAVRGTVRVDRRRAAPSRTRSEGVPGGAEHDIDPTGVVQSGGEVGERRLRHRCVPPVGLAAPPGAEVAAFLEGPTSIQRQPWAVDDQQIANPRGRGVRIPAPGGRTTDHLDRRVRRSPIGCRDDLSRRPGRPGSARCALGGSVGRNRPPAPAGTGPPRSKRRRRTRPLGSRPAPERRPYPARPLPIGAY